MADEPEKSGQESNLELPSLLGFGRRKKKKHTGDPAQEEPETEELLTPEAVAERHDTLDVPAEDGHQAAEPRGGLAPAAGAFKRPPPTPPPATTEPAVGGPETSQRDRHEPVRAAGNEQTTVLAASGFAEPPVEQFATPVHDEKAPPIEEPLGEPASPPPARTSRSLTMPALDPRIAAALTGALTGLAGVVLTFLAGRGCEAVRGVGSCGGIGLFALLLIVAIEVLLGAALLKAWRLSDPVSTSFLGVGLAAAFVLLFLLGSLESAWMVLVIPVVTALTFLLSLWVTMSFIEGIDDNLMR